MKTAEILELTGVPKAETRLQRTYKLAIVGAGCGDIELLTLKAARLISSADVIVYDALVSDDILSLAPEACELHFVGKRCGQPSAKQDDINELLLRCAVRGLSVVRLKGGDPNVFGRGCEEALFLARNGFASEFIPGVTAALGCAASAGIPLTHRGVARSVTLVTGTVFDDSAVCWQSLLSAQTSLVFYMGKEQAAKIAHGLLNAGANVQLPVAFVSNGARAKQILTYTNLGNMADTARKIGVAGPTLIIVGAVVSVGKELSGLMDSISDTRAEPALGRLAEAGKPV
ncbi:uroporphyrin-III C-methyltransferase [Shewanella sediminis HAW-EB3]|uniref:uroporphyrinogen-III C-methyltransferase n=1 Tax=Shewanella sediminis (strain HAW-EB3) TaxID=425104 RepID=A8FX02_SHESH|nr:uroporphyrinogen-III C-methyltransferase [Shewanella sediminis]ABV37375.1 uroporphyrin-III C-methyltransferase [Shewanella sediminis HAW-EB3]